MVKNIIEFLTNPEYNSIAVASISDLKIILPTAILTWIFRDAFTHCAKGTVAKYVDQKTFKTEEERKDRSLVICKWMLDFFYYSFSSITTYYILKDSSFLPVALMGSGNIYDMKSEDFPVVSLLPWQREIYSLQLGTHLYSFVHQATMRRQDKKFFEYMLHHGMALLLIFYSYSSNLLNVGLVVLLTHDFSDIFIVLARGYGDFSFKRKKILNVIYILAFSVWIYCRLYAFPRYCIMVVIQQLYICQENYKHLFVSITVYLVSMLVVLLILHLYWTVFLLKAQFNSFFKNKIKVEYDTRDKKAIRK